MTIHHDKRQLRIALAIVLAGALLAALILFSRAAPADAAAPAHAEAQAEAQHPAGVALSEAQIAAAGIALREAGPARIGTVTTLTGEIRFNEDRTAHVVPRLAGVVDSVRADLGQRVGKGQLLAVIASTTLSDQRSELLTAQKRLALARTVYAREQRLWDERVSAEQDYLQARQAMQEAEIAQQNAAQKLSALGAAPAAGGALNTYELRAPFAGVIVEKHIAPGESIKEESNVFTISDLSTVWAEIAVPAGQLGALKVGGKVVVKASALAATAEGTVGYVGALLGEQTRSAQARVVLANPAAAWRPGLFVTVDVASDAAGAAVAVASAAVQTVNGKPSVFVRTAGGFEARPVALGKTDGAMVEVLAGLPAGSRYAAAGSFTLKAELGKSSAADAHDAHDAH